MKTVREISYWRKGELPMLEKKEKEEECNDVMNGREEWLMQKKGKRKELLEE